MSMLHSSCRLSINLNKIALLRNSRHTGVPNLLEYAALAREAGVEGITIHPRPDERHIRREDVLHLADWMKPWRPELELNIEGYPDERLLAIVEAVRPEQCTLVPDAPTAITSNEGWKMDVRDTDLLSETVPAFKRAAGRVALFASPDPAVVPLLHATGADAIEIYTGSYAEEFRAQNDDHYFRQTIEAAEQAQALGLRINIGHDLNLENLPKLMLALPPIAEASIGHELTADALILGLAETIRAYRAALQGESILAH
jgi:pyridoxine 5-phosphate synthase